MSHPRDKRGRWSRDVRVTEPWTRVEKVLVVVTLVVLAILAGLALYYGRA